MNKLNGRIFGGEEWRNWTTSASEVTPLSGEYMIELPGPAYVRDPLGLKPVYYSNRGQVVHTLREIVALEKPLSIDWEHIYSLWADVYSNQRSTPYNEWRRLPPGHILEYVGGVWATRPYFRAIQPDTNVDLRELLFHILDERARAHPRFSLFLSGGFDSSLLFAALKKLGLTPSACTLNFNSGLESEVQGLAALREHTGGEFRMLDGASYDPKEFFWDPKSHYFYSPTLTLFKPLLHEARSRGDDYVWTGFGADEVFSREGSLLSSLLASADVRAFSQAYLQRHKEGRSHAQLTYAILREFMPYGIKRAAARWLPMNTELNLPVIRQIAMRRRQERLRPKRKHASENELWERLFHSGLISSSVEQEQELAAEYSLSFAYPFLDLRLVAYALTLPTTAFSQNGVDKSHLRSVFSDVVPAVIATRESHQSYDDWMERILMMQRSQIFAWLKSRAIHHVDGFELSLGLDAWSKIYLPKSISKALKLLYTAQVREPLSKDALNEKETLFKAST